MKASCFLSNSALVPLLAALLWTGCASPGTIQSRQQERAAAYTTFSPETKSLVDQGQIAVGMTTNAVYIAWGPPDDVIEGTDQHGAVTVWEYFAELSDESQYSADMPDPRLVLYNFEAQTYVRAMVVFRNDLVQRWDVLRAPGG